MEPALNFWPVIPSDPTQRSLTPWPDDPTQPLNVLIINNVPRFPTAHSTTNSTPQIPRTKYKVIYYWVLTTNFSCRQPSEKQQFIASSIVMCILKLENWSNYGSDKLTDPCQKLLTQWPSDLCDPGPSLDRITATCSTMNIALIAFKHSLTYDFLETATFVYKLWWHEK